MKYKFLAETREENRKGNTAYNALIDKTEPIFSHYCASQHRLELHGAGMTTLHLTLYPITTTDYSTLRIEYFTSTTVSFHTEREIGRERRRERERREVVSPGDMTSRWPFCTSG